MLKIKDLTKIYNKQKKAVDHVSLSIESGDIYGFIGGNGAGKTTTIKSVVGIHDFDNGSITIDGHSIKEEPVLCKKLMAYIPDNPDLYEHLTGYQYIHFIADLFDITTEERAKKIHKYSELFEMTKNLPNIISSYSHGMKQRTAIIAALVHSPKLLILDEPFVGLDPKATFTLKQIMQNLVSTGCAVFFSTHVLDAAEKFCNKVAIIKEGKVIINGEMKKVIENQSLETIFMEAQSNE